MRGRAGPSAAGSCAVGAFRPSTPASRNGRTPRQRAFALTSDLHEPPRSCVTPRRDAPGSVLSRRADHGNRAAVPPPTARSIALTDVHDFPPALVKLGDDPRKIPGFSLKRREASGPHMLTKPASAARRGPAADHALRCFESIRLGVVQWFPGSAGLCPADADESRHGGQSR